jgi:putative two-component system response regulator
MSKTIFVVDDQNTNLHMAEEALEEQYHVMTLPSATKMFALLEKVTPDLILLDIEMPDMDVFEALRRLKAETAYASIPVIFLTSRSDASTEVHGFQLGVVDFITKPFSAPVLLNRIRTHLNINDLIRERTAELVKLKNGIVLVLADIVENRDRETGGHIERTTAYIKILVDAMIKRKIYLDEIIGLDLDMLVSSARLHDVGKITIPDLVLNKPDKLTHEEFEIIKTHAMLGEHIINQIISRTGNVEFLHNAKLFTSTHHERWDGLGYPQGLKGAQIPLQGRIMAIVDVYDALLSKRPYKKPFTQEEAVRMIMDDAGKQFDPLITDVFFEVRDQFAAVNRVQTDEEGAQDEH